MEIAKVLENLRKNRYEATYFASGAEALNYLDSKIDGKIVGIGDSMTLFNLGVYDKLCAHNTVYDVLHTPNGTREEFFEYANKTYGTDIFLCSLNALTEDGILVNMDGSGNRVGSSLYGHEKVYFVVGVNKICPDLEKAIWRVRNIAAPKNCHRKKKKTPCAIKGDRCYNCSSPERICNGLLIEYKKMTRQEMEVIIIGEELGL